MAYRHFVVVGPESNLAAEASECAAEQGRFSDYHDILFSKQGPENQGYLTPERLRSFAIEIGLDGPDFGKCLDSGRYEHLIQKMSADAASFGIRSTPTVFVNGQRVQNPVASGAVLAAITRELSLLDRR